MTPLDFNAEALAAAGFPGLGRRFMLWRTFPPRREGGKPVKSPCDATGYGIDGTDERLWLDFDRAATVLTFVRYSAWPGAYARSSGRCEPRAQSLGRPGDARLSSPHELFRYPAKRRRGSRFR